jgi:ribosomal protein L40E
MRRSAWTRRAALTRRPASRARSACLQPASCNRSPNHLASMQMPYRDPANEWRSARERHGQNDIMRACGAMISADASTCPRCRTILSRTAVAPAGLVALLAISVLYVLLQRYW